LTRRVLEHFGIRIDGSADRRTTRLPELQSAIRVSIDEYALDGDFLRLVLRHDRPYAAKYFAQSRGKFAMRRTNDPARNIDQSRPGGVQHAKPGALRPRIYTEHASRRDLKRQASCLRQRETGPSSLKLAWPSMIPAMAA
jgi:hypothetical protein